MDADKVLSHGFGMLVGLISFQINAEQLLVMLCITLRKICQLFLAMLAKIMKFPIYFEFTMWIATGPFFKA
jgi:hypothetical protein